MLSNRVVFDLVAQEFAIPSLGRGTYGVGSLRVLKYCGTRSNMTGIAGICCQGID